MNRFQIRQLALIAFLTMIYSMTQAIPLQNPIKLDSGPISSKDPGDTKVRSWLGIPFAAPPTGPLRWKAPQPVTPWTEVRTCTDFGPICPQPARTGLPVYGNQSEDCLYLNIWSAAADTTKKRPVMVWIHGGGNSIGAASQRYYDGAHFAENGVVLISIQYRLGPFGYLAHPLLSAESPQGVSGNYGIQDIIAALQWVQRNIAAFGGNPKNVTIFGESAGAVNCGVILTCPQAKGLFHRVIMESGTPIGVRTHLKDGPNSAHEQGQQIFAKLGVTDLAQARAIPAKEIISAVPARIGILEKGHKYDPIIDGVFIPAQPIELMKSGQFNQVPILIGTNADEATLFTQTIPIQHAVGYRLVARTLFKDNTQAALEQFPPDFAGTPKQSFNKLTTLLTFFAPARAWSLAAVSHKVPVYNYYFSRVPTQSGKMELGATHGLEILYVFNNAGAINVAPLDKQLATQMQQYWINFAREGNPNGSQLPAWPAFTAADESALEFGNDITPRQRLYQQECQTLEKLVPNRNQAD